VKPKVLVVDDHSMIVHAIEAMIHEIAPAGMVLQSRTLLNGLGNCRDTPDLAMIVLDLNLPDCKDTQGLALMHAERPDIPIVVYTGQEHESVRSACLRAGASDFVMKSGNRDALYEVVERLLVRFISPIEEGKSAPKIEFSSRQAAVLGLLIEGATSKEIARKLSITDATVKSHIKAIYSRTFCRNRVELFQWYAAEQKAIP
jgi:DNA-binding NarL/FixJ family response regulator